VRRRLIQITALLSLVWSVFPAFSTVRAQTAVQQLELAPGWNLVALQLRGPEAGGEWTIAQLTQRFLSNGVPVAAPAALQFWAYEADKEDFTGRIPAQLDFPDNDRLTRLVPGRGYWIRSRSMVRLDAAIETLLPPDLDLPPFAGESKGEDAPFDLDRELLWAALSAGAWAAGYWTPTVYKCEAIGRGVSVLRGGSDASGGPFVWATLVSSPHGSDIPFGRCWKGGDTQHCCRSAEWYKSLAFLRPVNEGKNFNSVQAGSSEAGDSKGWDFRSFDRAPRVSKAWM
jgi:hypothetical protein